MARTLYDVLELSRYASADAIRAAHERLSAKFSPDTPGNAGSADADFNFKLVREAFATLGDPDRRRIYDESLREREASEDAEPAEKKPYWSFGKIVVFATMGFVLLGSSLWFQRQQERDQLRIEQERLLAEERAREEQREVSALNREEALAREEQRRREREAERERSEVRQALSEADRRMHERETIEQRARAEEERKTQMQIREMERRSEAERRESERRARQEQAELERKLREIEAERERARQEALRLREAERRAAEYRPPPGPTGPDTTRRNFAPPRPTPH